MSFYHTFFRPDLLALLIPIVAIVGGLTVAIVKMLTRHNERMAMIERGIHPDYPPPMDDVDENRMEGLR